MTLDLAAPLPTSEPHIEVAAPADDARLKGLVKGDYAFVWRSLRRLGVPAADADDGAQRVFGVLARRLAEVAIGAERSFLFQTALRVASEMRRSRERSRLVFDEPADVADDVPSPEMIAANREARALLDEAVRALDLDLAAVFVLFELEEMSTSEIAKVLGLPAGTVSTRLRRAREDFKRISTRLRANFMAERRAR